MISIIRVNNIIQKAWCILYSPVSDLIVIVHKLCGMIWLNDSHADTKQLATLVSNLCLSSLWVTAAAIPYHTSYVSSRQGGKSVDIIHFAYSSTWLIGAYSSRDKAKRERDRVNNWAVKMQVVYALIYHQSHLSVYSHAGLI